MLQISAVLVVLVSLPWLLSAELEGTPTPTQVKSYAGWKLLQIEIKEYALEEFLEKFDTRVDVSLFAVKRHSGDVFQVNAAVGPHFSPYREVPLLTQRHGDLLPRWRVLIEDLEPIIAASMSSKWVVRNQMDWTFYPRNNQIEEFVTNIALQRQRTFTMKIGTTFEGRSIYAVIIGPRKSEKVMRLISESIHHNASGADVDAVLGDLKAPNDTINETIEALRPQLGNIIFIEAGAHAREWISPALATYMINELSAESDEFLDQVTWVIIPLLNADGYEYTHMVDRLWRKNKRPNPSDPGPDLYGQSWCSGVDLNRNFDINFGGTGSSSSECSSTYRGSHALSEPESLAFEKLRSTIQPHVKLFLSIHCCGDMFLYPWSYDTTPSPHDALLNKVFTGIADSIARFNSTVYKVGPTWKIIYKASGVAHDYMHAEGTELSCAIELPDHDGRVFLIPEESILPTAKETYCAIRCTAYYIDGKPTEFEQCLHACGQ